MTSKEIRKAFLDFFHQRGHEIVPSAPIVVKNDPTLMFTNAGMNQFKALFLGEAPIKYSRVVNTQRCLRVSGKHNDLEEVGIDTYHHTMFEMLGNWSFGDYFKQEAIAWSWELLTTVYGIDKNRLYVTVFGGDEREGLSKDEEAYEIWKTYIDESRILLGSKKDNFWEMGETGPCGPCSEIHVDCRPIDEMTALDGSKLVNADHPQVIEIWNNVFMQFNRLKDGSLSVLPSKHVDTGMGFERLVRVLQGKQSNYDTDVFMPLIDAIGQAAKVRYGTDEQLDIAMRVMADHVRAISFAIADGQLPSNNKAGYVIRRILRRAVRYAYTFLHFKEPFLHTLVPILAEQFKGVFHELVSQQDFVQRVILEEEQGFLRTLAAGVQRFEAYLPSNGTIDGEFAFELYDTFGFPIDLTELMAREKNLCVDMEAFSRSLAQQKDRSRAATAVDTGDWVTLLDDEAMEFVGYDSLECYAQVIKYRKVSAKGKDQYQLVLNKTPFYAEGGGQVGDIGVLLYGDGQLAARILDTKKENGLIVHFTDSLPTSLAQQGFVAKVNAEYRHDIERNHTSTHLLHAALKHVLGEHVNQKGSLVNADVLRFDFSHFAKMTIDELAQVEQLVNEKIRENIVKKEQRDVPFQKALSEGTMALFGEKYGEKVRVITFDDRYSKELCGGCHVGATGTIGFFKILSESAVAAGVRRIEALSGRAAEQYVSLQGEQVQHIKELLRNPKDIAHSLQALLEENAKLKKEVEKGLVEKVNILKSDLMAKAQDIQGISFISERIDLSQPDAIKSLAYSLKDKLPNLFMVLGYAVDDKPGLTVMISERLVGERALNAGTIVRELAKEIKGGGGGQPFFATAGGKDVSGLQNALAKARSFIASAG